MDFFCYGEFRKAKKIKAFLFFNNVNQNKVIQNMSSKTHKNFFFSLNNLNKLNNQSHSFSILFQFLKIINFFVTKYFCTSNNQDYTQFVCFLFVHILQVTIHTILHFI